MEDWILIAVAAFVFGLVFLMRPKETPQFTGKRQKTWCPPHKWYYKDDGTMACRVCSNVPCYSSRDQ